MSRLSPDPSDPPAGLSLRAALRTDAAAIARLKVDSWRSVYSEWIPDAILQPFLDVERVERYVAGQLEGNANFGLVAMSREVLCGFAICTIDANEAAFLDALHVRPDVRGRGIGEQLLDVVLVEVRSREHRSLTVTVVAQNVRARRFYERHGARFVGMAPADWTDGDVMEAILRWDQTGIRARGL